MIRDQHDAARLAQAGQGRYAARAANDAATKLNSLIGECGGASGMMEQAGGDLDRKLQLARQKIVSGLAQLSQGRGIPGLGKGKGKSKGQGGGGYYGSRARQTLMGPHGGSGNSQAELNAALRASKRQRSDRKNRSGRGSEALSPKNEPERMGNRGVRSMPGMPVRYRGLVELYFRRLADESK